jgi:AraC-like DNA-binding protein
VRAFVQSSEGEHSRVAHRSGPVGFELVAMPGSTVSLFWASAAVEKTLRGAWRDPVLHLVIPEGTRYRIGRHEHRVGPLTAMFGPAQWEHTRRSPAGSTFGFMVHGGRLSAEIAARRPASRGDVMLQGRALALDDASRARFFDAASAIVDTAVGGVPSPHAENGLVAALADVLLAGSAVEHASELTASRVAAVGAWIDAHLEEPITLGRLCEIAGVGERALQKAFEASRGVPPMRFVVERRLAQARRLLESAGPGDGVTDVAVRLGFHLGRFAGLYREAFGETPSQTLARARR